MARSAHLPLHGDRREHEGEVLGADALGHALERDFERPPEPGFGEDALELSGRRLARVGRHGLQALREAVTDLQAGGERVEDLRQLLVEGLAPPARLEGEQQGEGDGGRDRSEQQRRAGRSEHQQQEDERDAGHERGVGELDRPQADSRPCARQLEGAPGPGGAEDALRGLEEPLEPPPDARRRRGCGRLRRHVRGEPTANPPAPGRTQGEGDRGEGAEAREERDRERHAAAPVGRHE